MKLTDVWGRAIKKDGDIYTADGITIIQSNESAIMDTFDAMAPEWYLGTTARSKKPKQDQ